MADHLYALPSGHHLEEYELQGVLSVDRYGIKYLAAPAGEAEQVAIKEYLPDGIALRQEGVKVTSRSSVAQADFAAGLAQFLDGARIQAHIDHPNLLKLHRWFEANGTGYIVMDYIEGETISALLQRRKTLPEAELRQAALPLLEVLEQMHDLGFLHQEIRSGDIIIRLDGSPLLLEPGLGRRTRGAARQAFGEQAKIVDLGAPTAGFSPLERYSSSSRLGPWTDIYSLGAVMYHCLAGDPPPDAPSRVVQDELVPATKAGAGRYDQGLLKAIDAALAITPGQRPTSIASWRSTFIKAEGADKADATRPGHVARGATRVAARGFGRPTARAPGAARETAGAPVELPGIGAKWALPTAAAVAVTALLTWMDVGILRSPQDSDGPPATARIGEEPQATPAEAADKAEAAPTESVAAEGAPGATSALATLVVRTEPPGAEVLLGDQLLGRTPLQSAGLPSGEYDLKIQYPSYETLEIRGQILVSGEVAVVERSLLRATGELQLLTEPPGAWVELDGERLAQATPATLEGLPAGPLRLRLGAEGYDPMEVDVQVPRGATERVEFRLLRSDAFGTLTLVLAPADASVALPDQDLPYSPGMRLAEGAHRVQVSAPGHRPETRMVEVAGDVRLSIALVAVPQTFSIAVTPPTAKVRLLNGGPYAPGRPLPAGDYRVRVTLAGYETWEETISHGAVPTQRKVALNPGIGEFTDPLAAGGSGPKMVLIPSGNFRMGCLAEDSCRDNEGPVREVTIGAAFALSKHEVTFADYDRFTEASERPAVQRPDGWPQGGGQPVVQISWEDAAAYAQWLATQTGAAYRLPSEAEWEYAARAGTGTIYSWGDEVGDQLANCSGCGSPWDGANPAPVGSFNANPWGLHDMHGNLWEWVQDCQSDSYQGAPKDAAPWLAGECGNRMLRGGAYSNSPEVIRAATREWDDRTMRDRTTGFRIAMTVDQEGEGGSP